METKNETLSEMLSAAYATEIDALERDPEPASGIDWAAVAERDAAELARIEDEITAMFRAEYAAARKAA